MTKYRRKKSTVDAWQWIGNSKLDIPSWISDSNVIENIALESTLPGGCQLKLTLSGGVVDTCDLGDWIVRDHNECFSIYENDDFKGAYEVVQEIPKVFYDIMDVIQKVKEAQDV